MKNLPHFYVARKNEFNSANANLQVRIRRFSLARLLVAIVFLLVLYYGFSNLTLLYTLFPIILVFIYLVSRQTKMQAESDLLKNLIRLNELEIGVLENDFSSFPDGVQYSNPDHPYSIDLDLFGKGSLYQFLNRCGTTIGERKLADDLLNSQYSEDHIRERQQAVSELASKVELRQKFWAHGHIHRDDSGENNAMLKWLKAPDFVFGKKGYLILLILAPIVSLVCIGLTIYSFSYFVLLFLLMIVQLTITGLHSKRVSETERALVSYQKVFERYSVLLKEIEKENFESPRLKAISSEVHQASVHIKTFSQLVNAFESRRNAIAYAFGNGLYQYDLQCIYRLEKWRSQYGRFVESWLRVIAEMDALISLSTFHFNNPENTFPSIHSEVKIKAEALGHPLIHKSERINNSFSIGNPDKIMLITGANMAGKSTFLRTVGVNIILALSGTSVCAREFTCSRINLCTSMRATDSLMEHQSYFYAELNRLKGLMDKVRSGAPVLVLLDEILRGTNSKDKQTGSIGLVVQFVSLNALVMLASHDIALGELEKQFPESIRNFCFESEIENDALTFDYKLHEGVAHKANATFLMQKMGILGNTPSSEESK